MSRKQLAKKVELNRKYRGAMHASFNCGCTYDAIRHQGAQIGGG